MTSRHALSILLCLLAAGLCFTTPADAQMHCSACDCESACGTPCVYQMPDPDCDDFRTCGYIDVNTTCSGWGWCNGTPGLCDTCSNLSCSSSSYGTSAADTLYGTSGRDCIYGNDGADTLYGSSDEDRLYGGNGDDALYGGSGDDCLFGGADDDHLYGDTGDDDFGDGESGSDNCDSTTETQVSC